MNTAAQTQRKFRFRGRSFIAFTLAPQPPIADWMTDLDEWVSNSPSFFIGQPIVLDLGAVNLSESAVAHLVDQMAKRSIRIMGLTGVDPATLSEKVPPVLRANWAAGVEETPGKKKPSAGESKPASSVQREPASLLLETPIRSGQTVNFPSGDVTILGSVASGAEIVAGGSIHVYGTLRGRAMAGSLGNTRARIFCSRNEAELLAIDGCFRTAETIAEALRSRPAQAWLEDADIKIAALA
ncbi:MAG TPA: septum site-determining protein MinC [Beijerinckiaceae bacterium]|nr:septum site-determining protein MinC [Beijerinckiaceae bacterium]